MQREKKKAQREKKGEAEKQREKKGEAEKTTQREKERSYYAYNAYKAYKRYQKKNSTSATKKGLSRPLGLLNPPKAYSTPQLGLLNHPIPEIGIGYYNTSHLMATRGTGQSINAHDDSEEDAEEHSQG